MNRSFAVTLITSMSFSATFSGCGGGGGSCGKVEPCGGPIVGNWKIVDSCLNSLTVAPPASSFCPQATIGTPDIKITGTASYNADSTYAANLMVATSVKLGFPPACLTSGGVTLTCAQLNSGLQAALAASPDPSIQSFTCEGGGSNCECTIVSPVQSRAATGTYSTAGTVLTSTPAGGTPGNDSYCVRGSTLHIVTVDMTTSMGPMGQASITADIVFSKQ